MGGSERTTKARAVAGTEVGLRRAPGTLPEAVLRSVGALEELAGARCQGRHAGQVARELAR